MRVLVVEDDRRVASFVRRGLAQEQFAVDVFGDGRDALHHAVHETYDAVVLDVVIPFMDGFQVLREVRRLGCRVPILILSARDSVEDRIRGLDLGADDYLCKPFAFAELTARLRALIRRRSDPTAPAIRVADLEIDPVGRRVTRGGRLLRLTPKEMSLLEYLARNHGNVVTRTMIAEHVWDQHFDTLTNVIDVHVRHIRAKVDDDFETRLIHTARGVGYVLSEAAP
jgi:heavy metal response regulator